MKLRLLILLAAALAASPAAGQTIKSLGYNTTNGQIVYSGTNDLRFPATIRIGTNQSGFSSGGQFLTLTDGAGGVAMIIGTNAITLYDPIAFSSTGNAATTRTNLALGETNTVTFSNIQLGLFGTASATGFAGRSSGGQFVLYGTNVTSSVPAFYGWSGFDNTAFSAGTARTNLGLGATNAVTFSNITANGTLTATGNVTLSGVNNTATSQTASSGSSLMTRDLSDDRYRLFYVPLVHALSSTAANGSTWNLRPFHSADAVFSAPPWARNVRVYLSTAFTNAPITNNFTVLMTAYALTTNTIGAPFTQATNALSVTQVYNNGSNFYRFILRMTNDLALPSEGISDAESASFWNILIQLRNNSSGSLTTPPDNWLRGMAVFSD